LGLLSRREERNVDLACGLDHPDGCPDGLVLPEAASLVQLPSDVSLEHRYAWGASADAHPDAMADARHPDLPDEDAGKLADLEPDAQAQDGWQSDDSRSAALA
jgi:hypothetical protein